MKLPIELWCVPYINYTFLYTHMTHISKKKLSTNDTSVLHGKMFALLASLDRKNSPSFFGELFSEAEQIMLIKRLAVIILLHEGYSTYRISHTLHMSPSTTERMKRRYERKEYQHIISVYTNEPKIARGISRILDILLTAGLSPRGKGRWKRVLQS
jgi:uncharacterized protein YerC